MKLEPITRLGKRNKTASKKKKKKKKKIDDDACREIETSLSFFGFLANLEQSGDRVPDTEPSKVVFSVIITSCLTKTGNITKNSVAQLSHYCFE